MKDIRVEVRIKNNLVLSMMEQAGIKNVAELSRLCGVKQTPLCSIVNMKKSPLTKKLEWRKEVLRLADFFKCLPEDLFSETHIENVLATNRTYAELNFSEIQQLTAQNDCLLPDSFVSDKQLKESINMVVGMLTKTEQQVMSLRFGLNDTEEQSQEAVSRILGVSRTRVAQIEAKAFRKLRHPSRSNVLSDFIV